MLARHGGVVQTAGWVGLGCTLQRPALRASGGHAGSVQVIARPFSLHAFERQPSGGRGGERKERRMRLLLLRDARFPC